MNKLPILIDFDGVIRLGVKPAPDAGEFLQFLLDNSIPSYIISNSTLRTGTEIVSYQAKWDPNHESYHKTIPKCPAKLSKKVETEAKNTALAAFKIMGCRDYARVDMRLSKDNQLFVLEVNPNPDLTDGAGFMRSAGAAGLSYAQSLKKIALLAWERRVNGR